MGEIEQDNSKEDLALILTRLGNLNAADSQQAVGLDLIETDSDENYPELTDIVFLEDIQQASVGVDRVQLGELMLALKPAIDRVVNRVVKRILLDARQPIKEQLETEIEKALLKILK